MNVPARQFAFQAGFPASATCRPAPVQVPDHDTDPVRGRTMEPGR